MSAASVIINRVLLASVLALLLAAAASPLLAVTPSPQGDSPADQLNTVSEQSGPQAGPDDVDDTDDTDDTDDADDADDDDNDDESGGGAISELDVVSIINADEQGKAFYMPTYVYHDQGGGETYVVDNGRVIVYGDNHFPVATIGPGRGLSHATGVHVDREGNVFVLRTGFEGQPTQIAVYNAAFLPVRLIDLSTIPGTESLVPRSMVISDNGFIYVASDSALRGLLVLDQEGRFSHWLKPTDLIYDRQAIVEPQESEAKEQEEEEVSEEAQREPDFDVSELVPELVPRQNAPDLAAEAGPGIGPVQVNDIQRDANGNLYLLSAETGKVYIYNENEEYLYSFGEKGGSTGKLSQPRQLVVDERKRVIYIVDYMRHAILIYDLGGRFMHELGGRGTAPGWFNYPRSIAANVKGELLVADQFNRRVQVLDVRFEYKFPLFQVPFVFEARGGQQPRPMALRDRFYGPGFSPGEQASVDPDRQEILDLLAPGGDMI